ncbi:MFS transporter [Paenibacillus sp. 32O-W]|uniref:MFS transporter n=1 Tax=Paenibacillus sp. 32O-W TaxID=1695218 RepID=UPI0011A67E68|nr:MULTISPECIES: MFS transporter [Paenibacillaceae]
MAKVPQVFPLAAGPREWFGLATLALPTLLLSIDLSVLYLAIPQISADLKPSASQTLWILDIYGFMIAGFLVTMGSLGDRVGRKKVLLAGATVFGITSVIAAYSVNPEMLVIARAFLGIAGATIMPNSLALISSMFRDSKQRSAAIAIWMSCFLVGTAIGPVIGGLLLERFWWGAVFLLGVPVMALVFITSPFLLPEYRNPGAGKLDILSVMLSLFTLLPIIYGLKKVTMDHHVWQSGIAILIGLTVGVAFVHRQRKAASPLLDLSLFKNRQFNTALTLMLFGGFFLSGILLFTTQYLQMVKNMTPLIAGTWMLLSSGVMIVSSLTAPLWVHRMKTRNALCLYLAIALIGCLILIRADADNFVPIIFGLFFVGFGASPIGVICTDLVIGSAPPEKSGSASSLSETSAEFGIAFGVAVLGSIGTAVYQSSLNGQIPPTPLDASLAIRESWANALATMDRWPEEIAVHLSQLAVHAFIQGFQAVAITSALLMAVLIICTWIGFKTHGNG